MKASELILRLQEIMTMIGDVPIDLLLEDLGEDGFGQIEMELGDTATCGERIKLLCKGFT